MQRQRIVSTAEWKCIGLPEQKHISDAGKKAAELGAELDAVREALEEMGRGAQ